VAEPSPHLRLPALGPCLLAGVLATAAFAAFDGGAVEVAAQARLQAVAAVLALVSVFGLLTERLTWDGAPLAWLGIALLAAYAAWCGLSILWSVAPDASWAGANRALTYAVLAAVALVAASSTPRPQEAVAAGLAIVCTSVAAYALLGKIAPGIHVGPLDLDPGNRFARLREPFDYWNALALLCVIGAAPCIWLGASREIAPRLRVAATVALAVLALTAALAYSRGGAVAYVAVAAAMVAIGPGRLPRLALAAGAPAAVAPAILVALARSDLSSSDVPLADRTGDGLLFGAVLLACLAGLALAARALIAREPGLSLRPERRRIVWRGLAAAAVAALLAGTAVLALSDRGLTGEISHQVEEFKQPQGGLANTPERFISSNGSSRYVWWEEATGAFTDRPIAGWGAGSFPTVHYLYRRYEAPVRSTHSLPLQLLSETGLIGALLGISALAALAAAGIRRAAACRGPSRAAAHALLVAALGWGLACLYDWHWEIPGVTVPALVALAAAASAPGRTAVPRTARRAAAGAAAVVFAMGMLVSGALPAASEELRLDALAAVEAGDLEQAEDDADLAMRLNPFSLEATFTAASIGDRAGMPLRALRLLEEAADARRESWPVWRRLAVAHSNWRSRRFADAIREWADADPLFFEQEVLRRRREVFLALHPANDSPTAFGTPPP
jgi:O-Antigen ligase